MKTIVIASQNPVKIEAARSGFETMFPGESFEIRSVSVPSGVGHQPMSSPETLRGAKNRAHNARQALPQADYWVGIEGGIEQINGEMAAFAWIFVLSPQRAGKSQTGTFFLPSEVAELVQQGKELGDADDIVFERSNSKQKDGAIGILTGNIIDRTKLYQHAVVLALVPFRNPELYIPENHTH